MDCLRASHTSPYADPTLSKSFTTSWHKVWILCWSGWAEARCSITARVLSMVSINVCSESLINHCPLAMTLACVRTVSAWLRFSTRSPVVIMAVPIFDGINK